MFDANIFGISSSDSSNTDPQQRLALDVIFALSMRKSYASKRTALLESRSHSGIIQSGSATGVYTGVAGRDYNVLHTRLSDAGREPDTSTAAAAGSQTSVVPGRISYTFGLKGPSLSIDTACSSSLVAIQVALVDAQRHSSSCSTSTRAALVLGVNLILVSEINEKFWAAGMLSDEGRCKTFDACADGYGRAEDCLAAYLCFNVDNDTSDRRNIGFIRLAGAAVNQDGRSSSLTAPNGPSQTAVILDALMKETWRVFDCTLRNPSRIRFTCAWDRDTTRRSH
jgi:acyl transferase domain-containing protein